jgi:uncharacterized protein (DUF1778 family)
MKLTKEFFETILNPPEPNEKLKEALKRYRKEVNEKGRKNKNI